MSQKDIQMLPAHGTSVLVLVDPFIEAFFVELMPAGQLGNHCTFFYVLEANRTFIHSPHLAVLQFPFADLFDFPDSLDWMARMIIVIVCFSRRFENY